VNGIEKESPLGCTGFPKVPPQVDAMAYVQAFLSLIFSTNHDIGGFKLSQ
jgi:hypothetical protein